MRKAILIVTKVVFAAGILFATCRVMIRRDNTSRVRRAESVIRDLQELQVGVSGAAAAADIASKYGNAPPPRSTGNVYQKENCAAKDHLDECTYVIALNNNPILRKWLENPKLRVFRIEDWWGYVTISIKDNKISNYSYWLWFLSVDGTWRGISGGQSPRLPISEMMPISKSYNVDYDQRNRIFKTELTPTANESERRRASHLDLSCIAQGRSCRDACQLFPDASRDLIQKITEFAPSTAHTEHILKELCNAPPF